MPHFMKENYKIERTCSTCGHIQQITVSKREIAFELVNINDVLGDKCEKCSKTTFSLSYEKPDLDFELLKYWSTNLDLYLMPQDEELILADEKYLDMVLEILDKVEIPDQKRNLLIDALCILVYDNSIEDNSNKDDELKKRVINELNKRKDKLKLADKWIMDYIKKVVYPQLELH
jgi:hypothetical protein